MFLSKQFLQGLFSSHFALSCRQLSQAYKKSSQPKTLPILRDKLFAMDVPVMLFGTSVSHPRWGRGWSRDRQVPWGAGHTSGSVRMGWEEAPDGIVALVEAGMLDADTFAAAPGRCRNSCASAPPYVVGEDGHAMVVAAETARDRCRSS